MLAGLAPLSAAQAGPRQQRLPLPSPFGVTTVNHLSLSVADYARNRDFYVDVFGMRIAWDDGTKCALEFGSTASPNGLFVTNAPDGAVPSVNHIAFGLPNFRGRKAALYAALQGYGLSNVRADGEDGWLATGLSGYQVEIVATRSAAMFPGASSHCAEAQSTDCRVAYAAGRPGKQRELGRAPALKASAFASIVLNVLDPDREIAFYRDILGMQVINGTGASGAEHFLRFGENVLCLRRPPLSDGGSAHGAQFALAISNYEHADVFRKLAAAGVTAQPHTDRSWSLADPGGLQLVVSAANLATHIANACARGRREPCGLLTGIPVQ